MRLLILSEKINWIQQFGKEKFTSPSDVHLVVANLNHGDGLAYSVFDFDVAVVHIHPGMYNTIGYQRNLPKVAMDTLTALEHGRSVILLPDSQNFSPGTKERSRGHPVYDWLERFGVRLRTNTGSDIKPSGAGRAQVIQEYLKCAPVYRQIIIEPETQPELRLATVDDTEIAVGLEHPIGQGTLVILPPPRTDGDTYILAMSGLVEIARRYYERAQRRISVGDTPDWVTGHLVPAAIDLDQQIKKLAEQKARYDRIAYVLYGTGEELEESVALLLEELDLKVERQSPGSNIDLTADHPDLGIGFALEVTGTKGIIRKDSNKIAQAWQYLNDRLGTTQEKNRLVIVPNTEYHLAPKDRNAESFTPEVVKLLGNNEVLLVTAIQLYEQWRAVHEGKKSKEDIVTDLHTNYGLYDPK